MHRSSKLYFQKQQANKANTPAQKQLEVAELIKKGVALHQQGHLAQANVIYQQVLAKQPNHFDALHLSGVISLQSKNPAQAAQLIGKAIEVNPNDASAHCNCGVALKELSRLEDALVSYGKAIAIKPDYADAYNNRGNALKGLNRLEEAVASYEKAIAMKPEYAEAHTNRGVVLRDLGRLNEALADHDKAITIKPDYAEAHSNRGNALQELGRFKEALASYDKAIEISPEYSKTFNHRGVALKELERLEEALSSYDKAIAMNPECAEAYYNRGNTLREFKRLEEALKSYDNAIAIEPDFADAHWNKSLALLVVGEFRQGWASYEWRWAKKGLTTPKRNFPQPLWLGVANIADKTILLHAEQGLGDTIQFCRYAKMVKSLGARVVLEVPPALSGLLNGLQGVDTLVQTGQALPEFDYHCPLMSLPLAFKTELLTIPSPSPYLCADGHKLEQWSAKLGERKKPRIGLVWSGSTTHKNDHNRSLKLEELLAYLPKDYEYVSLQKEVRQVDTELLAGSDIRHYGQELKDFSDTAALCALMDIVISVDTSVAHLAGAIGKPTWVLLPYVPDWRWLLDRDDSPWYESVRLYRQSEDRRWEPVLECVAKDLAILVAQLDASQSRALIGQRLL